MNLYRFRKLVFSSSVGAIILGILLILLAVEFYNSGQIKQFFPLGEGRIPLSIFTFIMGILFFIQGVKSMFKHYKEISH